MTFISYEILSQLKETKGGFLNYENPFHNYYILCHNYDKLNLDYEIINCNYVTVNEKENKTINPKIKKINLLKWQKGASVHSCSIRCRPNLKTEFIHLLSLKLDSWWISVTDKADDWEPCSFVSEETHTNRLQPADQQHPHQTTL